VLLRVNTISYDFFNIKLPKNILNEKLKCEMTLDYEEMELIYSVYKSEANECKRFLRH